MKNKYNLITAYYVDIVIGDTKLVAIMPLMVRHNVIIQVVIATNMLWQRKYESSHIHQYAMRQLLSK